MLELGSALKKYASLRFGSLLLLVSAPLSLTPTGCTSDGLIGGDCAEGFDFCDGACIPVTDDEANCGACNNACRRRLACVEGLCGGPDGDTTIDDLTGGAGGMGGEDPGSGGISVGAGGPGGDGGTGGGGNPAGGGQNGGSGGAECLPPFDTPAACGDCNTQCTGAAPNCSPDGSGDFECVANCLEEPFTTQCSGECVDVETNPRHCGECFNRCPSGICVDGECVGAQSGHMVAMCMSFQVQSSQQTKLLANTAFLAGNSPVRVLGYVADTPNNAEAGTDFALSQATSSIGRGYELTKISDPEVIEDDLRRANYDMFLVYDQPNAEAGKLADIGAAWASTVETYTRTGGVVVVLTGGRGTNEMADLISELGMFSPTGTVDHTGARYYVQSPGDAVGINVVSPFQSVASSCIFETSDPSGGDVVFVTSDTDPEDGLGLPGVVHRTVVD